MPRIVVGEPKSIFYLSNLLFIAIWLRTVAYVAFHWYSISEYGRWPGVGMLLMSGALWQDLLERENNTFAIFLVSMLFVFATGFFRHMK